MAQDIEARSTGNSALVIGLVAVVLAVALGAFLFMRPSGDTTTIVDRTVPAGNTTIVNPPAEINVAPSTDSSPNVTNADSGSSSSTSVTSSTTTSDPASGSSTTSSTTTTSNQ